MTNKAFTESVVEEAALAWLEGLGYVALSGPAVVPGEPGAERDDYGQVVLGGQLRETLQRLNPEVPEEALDDAFRKLTRPDSPSLVGNNHAIHKYLVEGVPVEYQRADGSIGGDLVQVLDYDDPENNEFLAVHQFTVVEDGHERRADVVLFVTSLADSGPGSLREALNQPFPRTILFRVGGTIELGRRIANRSSLRDRSRAERARGRHPHPQRRFGGDDA